MTKQTFLKKLETGLSSLGEQRVDEILKKYERIIDEEVSKGNLEKDVIASLGSIDLITKLYLGEESPKLGEKESVNREDENKSSHHKTESTNVVDNVIDHVLKYIHDGLASVSGDQALQVLRILCYVAVGIVATILINIPFKIFDVFGNIILSIVFDDFYFYKVVSTFWSFSLSICYAVLIIWLIVKYINKIVVNNNHYVKTKVTKETKEDKVNNEIKETIKITPERGNNNTVWDVIFVILRVFVIILTIPLLMVEVALFIALFAAFSLLFTGVTMFGPIIAIAGLVTLVAALLDLIYLSISKGGIK